ncbi:MAG: M20/M25/M40 family metallo-hydrolase [Planctomycetes bacterium]|nr:M20/M25/M40 family metallo-hydrolase [Planctomycetota bacterium]
MNDRMRLVVAASVTASVLISCAGTPASRPSASATSAGPATEKAGLDITFREPGQWVSLVDGKEAPPPAIEMGDDQVTMKILREGALNSKVMDNLKALTVERGPRLTGSSNLKRAQDWASQSFREWGLTNVHLEQWGTVGVGFDRGPSSGTIFIARPMRPETRPGVNTRDAAANTAEPAKDAAKEAPKEEPKVEWTKVREVELTALSWSIGTNGTVRGPVIREPKDEAEYAAMKDSLKGSWVLLQAPPALGMRGIRSMMSARYDMRKEARKKVAEGKPVSELPIAERLAFEPIAGYISSSRDERVWTGAVSGWRDLTIAERDSFDDDQPHVQVRLSDYDFLNSRLADGEKVEVEFNLDHKFRAGPVPEYNVVAEIKGSKFPDEYVIISGHLDSWDGPGSQGATDNGTGSAVTLEAARILKAVGARPLRTIRFVLWAGEEQGLLGSKGYVESHKDELAGISAVFVDDGGTGYQGGVQVASPQVEMLAAATAPMNNVFFSHFDKKFLNVDVKNTGEVMKSHGGSDHHSFNQAGVPGFFWEEGGRADYQFGWHTQNDKINLAIEEYLIQSATNSAVVAYRLGCAPTLLPRAKVEANERPNMLRREQRQQNSESTPQQPAANPSRS